MERGISQVELDGLLEMKIQSWKSRETKAPAACRAMYQREESCVERKPRRSLDILS